MWALPDSHTCSTDVICDVGKIGETIGASYQLEYGEDRIEMHLGHVKEGQRVLLIDDLIATGGTLAAGIKLMNQVRASQYHACLGSHHACLFACSCMPA